MNWKSLKNLQLHVKLSWFYHPRSMIDIILRVFSSRRTVVLIQVIPSMYLGQQWSVHPRLVGYPVRDYGIRPFFRIPINQQGWKKMNMSLKFSKGASSWFNHVQSAFLSNQLGSFLGRTCVGFLLFLFCWRVWLEQIRWVMRSMAQTPEHQFSLLTFHGWSGSWTNLTVASSPQV